MDQKLWQATEARVKWLKKDFLFHYGNLKMPDPAEDRGYVNGKVIFGRILRGVSYGLPICMRHIITRSLRRLLHDNSGWGHTLRL